MPASPSRDIRSPDPLEAQARAHLAAGRWRKARDAFKELCKGDRVAFQPSLIEANVGLARSMLDKRLISDAQQVLAYLKTVASPETIAALESEIATVAVDSSKPAPDPVVLLAEGSLSPTDQRRMADQLVVAFSRGTMETQTSAQAQVVADLRAIQQAIEATCLDDPDRALELVRPIKRESAFAHWRLFVRAVAAYQRGESEKAMQYFEQLPPDSGSGRAGAAWLLALGIRVDTGQGPRTEAVLDAAGALSGEHGWGRVLARAEALWCADKHAASYRAVRDAKASFPSDGVDLSSALSDFYFNSTFALHQDYRDPYADMLSEIEVARREKNPTELKLIRRLLCLLATSGPDRDFETEDLRQLWEGFLQGHERAHGPNPRLASAAWCWLGEVLARPLPPPTFFRRTPQRGDSNDAIAALEKSIALDPTNISAHLRLASVYATARRVRDRNRLLDVMVGRFPDDKKVLLVVGAACLDRKATVKATDYYERALALDRLDPTTPDLLVSAYLRLALQHMQKRRLAEGRRVLDRASEFVLNTSENFVRSRWCLAARRGVLEMLYGDAPLSAASLEEARATSPSSVAFAFFVRLAWTHYDVSRPLPAPFEAQLKRAATEQPNVRDAVTLVQLRLYWTDDGLSTRPGSVEESWLRRYLKGAARNPFIRDDAAGLLELLRRLPGFSVEALAFTSPVLKRDPTDPLFGLYRELLQPYPRLTRAQIVALLAEARRRKDVVAEQLAHDAARDIGMIELVPPMWEEEDEDLDDFDDDDADSANVFPPRGPEISPELVSAVAAMLELMAGMPTGNPVRPRKPTKPTKPTKPGSPGTGADSVMPVESNTQRPVKKPAVAPDPQQSDLF